MTDLVVDAATEAYVFGAEDDGEVDGVGAVVTALDVRAAARTTFVTRLCLAETNGIH
jgi:hypothetical protein